MTRRAREASNKLMYRDHMASIVTSASIVDPIDDDIAIDNEISAPAVSRNNRSTLKSPPPGSSANRVDERVTINLRMVADPARREQGDSARAIARYEMKRVVRVNRVSSFGAGA